jgi:predicted metalloprotease
MALWDKISTRGDVEDRRGQAVSMLGLGGFGSILSIGILLFTLFSGGGDPSTLNDVLSQLSQLQNVSQPVDTKQFEGDDSYEVFASKVIGSSNDSWSKIFSSSNKSYQAPKLVLFRNATQSGCGFASSQVGPHYCPNDQTIYLDETFFEELTNRFGAKGGDLAEAYVLAHEVGHHVQNLLGVLDQAQSASRNTAIAIELQADCYAGIWARSVAEAGVLEPTDISEAIDAAEAVGDDRIQESVQGQVTPETWTHGSSEDRKMWFQTGYGATSVSQCNTFD